MNHDLMRAGRLPQQFSASLPNVSAQNRMPVLRHLHHMILAVQTIMAAARCTLPSVIAPLTSSTHAGSIRWTASIVILADCIESHVFEHKGKIYA
jgi:hypothetical protein